MTLLHGLIQGAEPSLRGLAVHRLRQEAAAAWPAPGTALASQIIGLTVHHQKMGAFCTSQQRGQSE